MSFFNLFKSKKTTPEVNPVKEVVVEESPVVVEKVLSEDEIAENNLCKKYDNMRRLFTGDTDYQGDIYEIDFMALDFIPSNDNNAPSQLAIAMLKNNKVVFKNKWFIYKPDYRGERVEFIGKYECLEFVEIYDELFVYQAAIVVALESEQTEEILNSLCDHYRLDRLEFEEWREVSVFFNGGFLNYAKEQGMRVKKDDALSRAVAIAKLYRALLNSHTNDDDLDISLEFDNGDKIC